MGSYLSANELNRCHQSYGDIFSPIKQATSIKTHSLPASKNRIVEKCENIGVHLQKGSRCPVIYHGEQKEIIENKNNLTARQISYYDTPKGIVKLNEEGIELAVERRIALFLQHAILCYGMSSFTFAAGGADGQIGSSSPITLSSSTTRIIHKREAAHSSTLPCLMAYAKDGSTPQGFPYLKGPQHDTTIGMHECVNGADELIDGKEQDNKLRATAVKILNRVAQGLDPVKATEEFIQSFKKEVKVARVGLQTKEIQGQIEKRRLVLELYQQKIKEIQLASQEKGFYDLLIGVQINPDDPNEDKLRQVIYKKRYDIIRLQEVIESRIGKRILDVQAKMGSRDKSLLEHILLKEFAHTRERQIVEKLLSKTAVIFEPEYGQKEDGTRWITAKKEITSLKSFQTRITNLQKKYRKDLEILKRDLRADFRELTQAEYAYRSGVFKDLRTKVHQWRQVDFCEQYLDTTGNKISQAWVSRMEQLSRVHVRDPNSYASPVNQRRRYVTLEDARNCAETFGVDPGLLLPSLFTSS